MKSKILPCSCKNEGQDKLHGKGKRVMNETSKSLGDNTHEYRCTVCLAVHHGR